MTRSILNTLGWNACATFFFLEGEGEGGVQSSLAPTSIPVSGPGLRPRTKIQSFGHHFFIHHDNHLKRFWLLAEKGSFSGHGSSEKGQMN